MLRASLFTSLLGAAAAALALVIAGPGEDGLRLGLRLTAAVVYVAFLAVFAATPLLAVWPSAPTRWLRRHRRAHGVAVAAAAAVHAALIVALALAAPTSFTARLAASTAIGGGLGFALLAAMAATSWPRPAAALGRAAWRAVHTTGVWWLAVIFASSYAGRATQHPAYATALAPVLAIAVLRAGLALARLTRRGAPARSARSPRRAT